MSPVGCSVLVVDDNPGFRGLACRILQSWGHDVIEAGTAAEALSQMVERAPQVALVDIGLPDDNGLELARQLLRIAPTACVVVTSSDADAGFSTAAREVGAVFFAKDELTSPQLEQLLGEL